MKPDEDDHLLPQFPLFCAVSGLLIPSGAFVLFNIARCVFSPDWIMLFEPLSVITIFLAVEGPAIMFGRAPALPLQSGATRFPFDLSPFGYFWVILYWVVFAMIILLSRRAWIRFRLTAKPKDVSPIYACSVDD